MLSTRPQLLAARRHSYVVVTLLAAGAAHIQNYVLLGVDSDKVATLKGQVARWKPRERRTASLGRFKKTDEAKMHVVLVVGPDFANKPQHNHD